MKYIKLKTNLLNIISGVAIQNAETIYTGYKKKTILKETLPKAWNKIVSDRDDVFIELISETTEKLCGYKPDNEMVENFIYKNKDRLIISVASEIKVTQIKPIQEVKVLTPAEQKYRKFWTSLLKEFRQRNPRITRRKTGKQTWVSIGIGIGGIHLEWSFYSGYQKPNSWMQTGIHFERDDKKFNHSITEYFENKRQELEEKIGDKLYFQKEQIMKGKWSKIYARKDAEVISNDLKEWLLEKMRKFYVVFKPVVEECLKK